MSKKSIAPQAVHDFVKANAADTALICHDESLTRQEFAEECDINTLMRRYEGHAQGPSNLPMRDPGQMFYADFTVLPSSVMEFHEYMNTVQASFMSLPAAVRKEFNNSPYEFVDFASDPENLPQLRTWGLAAPEKAPAAPIKVEVVSPGPPAKPADKGAEAP